MRFGALDPRLLEWEPALVQEMEDLAAGVPAEGADHGLTLPAGVEGYHLRPCGPRAGLKAGAPQETAVPT